MAGLLLRLCICNNVSDISLHYDHFIHFNEGQDNTIVPDIKKGWMGWEYFGGKMRADFRKICVVLFTSLTGQAHSR